MQYVQNLKVEFPELHVGIIYVTASLDTLLARVKLRAAVTGREVPTTTVRETYDQVPRAVLALTPLSDVVVTFDNDHGAVEPRLLNLSYPKLEKLQRALAREQGREVNGGSGASASQLQRERSSEVDMSSMFRRGAFTPLRRCGSGEEEGLYQDGGSDDDIGRCLSVADLQAFHRSPSVLSVPTLTPDQVRRTPSSSRSGLSMPGRDRPGLPFPSPPMQFPMLSSSIRRDYSNTSLASYLAESPVVPPPAVSALEAVSTDSGDLPPINSGRTEPAADEAWTIGGPASQSNRSLPDAVFTDTEPLQPLPQPGKDESYTTFPPTDSLSSGLNTPGPASPTPVRRIRAGQEPCVRALAQRCDRRADNDWWRGEFQTVFEIRCLLPDR